MHPPLDNRMYDRSLPWLQGKSEATLQSELAALQSGATAPKFEAELAAAAQPAHAATAAEDPKTRVVVTPNRPAEPDGKNFFGEDGFTFGDLIDMINPLQHIPIISTIYQKLTGDEMSTGANILGGALLGGLPGLLAGVATEIVTQESGQSPGEHLLAAVGFGDKNAPVQLAQARDSGPAPSDGDAPQAAAQPTVQAAPVAAVTSAPSASLPIANLAPDATIVNEMASDESAGPRRSVPVVYQASAEAEGGIGQSFRDRIGANRIYGGRPNRYAAMPAKDKLQTAVAQANPEQIVMEASRGRGERVNEVKATAEARQPSASVIHRQNAASAALPRAEQPGEDFGDFLEAPELADEVKNLAARDAQLNEDQLRAAALQSYEADTRI